MIIFIYYLEQRDSWETPKRQAREAFFSVQVGKGDSKKVSIILARIHKGGFENPRLNPWIM